MEPVSPLAPTPAEQNPPPSLRDGAPQAWGSGTSLRIVAPRETLARVDAYRAEMGITRLANITGLDVVGLPVVVACRPNARSNAVSQGKGTDLDAAKASALMEAVETYHAERIGKPVWYGCAEDLGRHHRLANCETMAQLAQSRFSATLNMLWIEGRDLLTEEPVLVPYEAVHAAFVAPYPPGSGCFLASTNGLASGNNRLEAILHGLCEVVERDAATMFDLRRRSRTAARLDLASVDDSQCRAALASFQSAGLLLAIWDMTCDTGIPAFWCQILERPDWPRLVAAPTDGHGCHPSRSIALLRALTEAAQTRAIVISGTRDDVTAESYKGMDDPAAMEAWRRHLEFGQAPLRFTDVRSYEPPSLEAAVEWLVVRLAAAGLREIIVVDLAPAGRPYSVVRVVVPGLEPPLHAAYAPGQRARSAAL